MINIYKTYNKAKDVFAKPKLKFSISCGNKNYNKCRIRIAKMNQYYFPHNASRVKVVKSGDVLEDGSVAKYDRYEFSYHKLPIERGDCVWKSDIRRKLRKYHLNWLKPVYYLPSWLTFDFYAHDVYYKWKYDDIRFEKAPSISLTLFGITFEWTLRPILEDDSDNECFYWESLLSYLYQPECYRNIKNTLNFCGKWYSFSQKGKSYFQLRKTHLKKEYHSLYDTAVEDYKKK